MLTWQARQCKGVRFGLIRRLISQRHKQLCTFIYKQLCTFIYNANTQNCIQNTKVFQYSQSSVFSKAHSSNASQLDLPQQHPKIQLPELTVAQSVRVALSWLSAERFNTIHNSSSPRQCSNLIHNSQQNSHSSTIKDCKANSTNYVQ